MFVLICDDHKITTTRFARSARGRPAEAFGAEEECRANRLPVTRLFDKCVDVLFEVGRLLVGLDPSVGKRGNCGECACVVEFERDDKTCNYCYQCRLLVYTYRIFRA